MACSRKVMGLQISVSSVCAANGTAIPRLEYAPCRTKGHELSTCDPWRRRPSRDTLLLSRHPVMLCLG